MLKRYYYLFITALLFLAVFARFPQLFSGNLLPNGDEARIIGSVLQESYAEVILKTELGGERFLEELEDDPLPRIC